MTADELLRSTWRFDPLALLACAAALGIGWHARRRPTRAKPFYLGAGAATVVLAVASPGRHCRRLPV